TLYPDDVPEELLPSGTKARAPTSTSSSSGSFLIQAPFISATPCSARCNSPAADSGPPQSSTSAPPSLGCCGEGLTLGRARVKQPLEPSAFTGEARRGGGQRRSPLRAGAA